MILAIWDTTGTLGRRKSEMQSECTLNWTWTLSSQKYLYPHYTGRRFSGNHGVYGASSKSTVTKRLGMSDFAVLVNSPRFLHAGITLVKISLHQYYAHCVFLLRLYRAFYTIKPINMRSKYDQGMPVAFVVRLGHLPHASDTLMALDLLYKSAINWPIFLHSSTGYQISWTYILDHAAAIQIAVPQKGFLPGFLL